MDVNFFRASLVCLAVLLGGNQLEAQDLSVPLDGTWTVSLDQGQSWQPVIVPGTIEDQLDINFDGVSRYRKTIKAFKLESDTALRLRFTAVATYCEVFFNGVLVGSHLGGWTPFVTDVTQLAKQSPDGPWQIEVICDERVGHNTQGFLPVFAPHFGGIWQGVRLIRGQSLAINSEGIGIQADLAANQLKLEIPLLGDSPTDAAEIRVQIRQVGGDQTSWQPMPSLIIGDGPATASKDSLATVRLDGNRVIGLIPLNHRNGNPLNPPLDRWSPENPRLYEVRLTLRTRQPEMTGRTGVRPSTTTVRFGIREVAVDGSRLLLNGSPIQVRGLLNWGYAPPSVAPTLNEEVMRREIELARNRGFNLIKFCLWIPPKRYLELCDELGMLAWVEYPAWHPDFSAERMEELETEYNEFFEYDRNHPSVVLRSLTCETGPSANLEVIRRLYDLCKSRIPGAIVEDDSSWIAWNRIHDFYDDHPYGNNHTWVQKLNQLNQFIGERETKPLILGEAIAADTWTDPEEILAVVKDKRPHWLPQNLAANQEWLQLIGKLTSPESVENLGPDSKIYAQLMRKFQIEAYRREVPDGGYVVSVIRDIPFCSMGLVDYLDRGKFPPSSWAWHGSRMLLLATPNDQRSFFGGQTVRFPVTYAANDQDHINLAWSLRGAAGRVFSRADAIRIGEDTAGRPRFECRMDLPSVQRPTRFVLECSGNVAGSQQTIRNGWPIWCVPRLQSENVNIDPSARGILEALGVEARSDNSSRVRVTTVLNEPALRHAQAGGQVLLLPNDQPGSLPLRSHWFLRGGPLIDTTRMLQKVPRQMLVELQHFDLAGDVVPQIQHYLEDCEPIMVLWDNHDLKHVNTHGLIYRMPFSTGGSVLVSAVNHTDSPAGQYLFHQLVNDLARRMQANATVAGSDLLNRLKQESLTRSIRLDQRDWRFRPDPDQHGVDMNWHLAETDDRDWSTITIQRHWESQGHPNLDGWAWYRLKVQIPKDWPKQAYLNFTGVDDHYRLYVDGAEVGQSGDIKKRLTAFDEKRGYDISQFVRPGQTLQIAIAVYDWYGAGGIFRPVTLDTEPITDRARILK